MHVGAPAGSVDEVLHPYLLGGRRHSPAPLVRHKSRALLGGGGAQRIDWLRCLPFAVMHVVALLSFGRPYHTSRLESPSPHMFVCSR
jgi:hypothetical protein